MNHLPRRLLPLALALTAALGGCVIPAAMDAARHWDDYRLLEQRQVDADHFVAVVSVDHDRGEFDVLGSHGSHVVTRSVDVLLVGLAVTPGGLQARRLDARTFESDEDLEQWRSKLSAGVDATNQHLLFTREPWRGDVRNEQDLVVDDAGATISSRVHGRACSVPMPPGAGTSKNWPGRTLSDDGGHVLVHEIGPAGTQAVLLDLCDPLARRYPVTYQAEVDDVGISVGADGGPRVLRMTIGTTFGRQVYEARLYPGLETLVFSAQDFGLAPQAYWPAPQHFMVDDTARRFHWIVKPQTEHDKLMLITHDFATGATTRLEAPLPGP